MKPTYIFQFFGSNSSCICHYLYSRYTHNVLIPVSRQSERLALASTVTVTATVTAPPHQGANVSMRGHCPPPPDRVLAAGLVCLAWGPGSDARPECVDPLIIRKGDTRVGGYECLCLAEALNTT